MHRTLVVFSLVSENVISVTYELKINESEGKNED